jgi:hypothetical protein
MTLRDWLEAVAPLLGLHPTLLDRIPLPEGDADESNQTVFLPHGERFWIVFDSAEAAIAFRIRMDQAATIVQVVLAENPRGEGAAQYRLFTPAGGLEVFPTREDFDGLFAFEWQPEPGTEPHLAQGEALVLEAERGRLLPRGVICGRFGPPRF